MTKKKDYVALGDMRPMRIQEIRAKIETGKIIARIQKHLDGEVELSGTQMKAAEILLRKALPDLTSTELTGDKDRPLVLDTSLNPTEAYLRMIGKG